jgi:hypothetical protein
MSNLSLAALGAGTEAVLGQAPSANFAHVTAYLDRLEAGLLARGLKSVRSPLPECRSAILSFVPPAPLGAAELSAALSARGVTASTPDGLLRFAPHYSNSLDEIDSVLGALDEALSAARA